MLKCGVGTCEIVKENRCCKSCSEKGDCSSLCSYTDKECDNVIDQNNEIITFENKSLAILEKIKEVTNAKKEAEEQEKKLKEELEKAMTEFGVKKFSNDFISISWVEPTTSNAFDSKKFQVDHPKLYDEYIKTSNKKGYVKITVK